MRDAFYEATGWRRDNSYAALNSTTDALLNFRTPRGLRLTLSALASPNFATSYQLGSVGVVDGSISYLFSSVPLRLLLTPQSENVPLPDLLRSYRPLTPVARRDVPSLRRPDDEDKTNESLLYGRLYLPRSQLEALLVRRLSPALQAQFSAVSGQHLRDGGTALGLLQYDVGRYALEGLASTDGGLLGFRGVYNFGGDLSSKKHAQHSAASTAENGNGGGNGDKERIYGRFSTGGEIYYGTLNKSGGISIGARFATLPDHKGTPLSATLTLNPLMGNIAASYAVMAGKECSLATRLEFNIFSYESSWAVGMELWRKPFARLAVEGEPSDAESPAKTLLSKSTPAPTREPTNRTEGTAPTTKTSNAVPVLVPVATPAERSFNAKLEWRLDEPEKATEKKTGSKMNGSNVGKSKGSKKASVKGQPVHKVEKVEAEAEKEKEQEYAGVVKARLDQNLRLGVLWEGRVKSLLFSLGSGIDLKMMNKPFRTLGLEDHDAGMGRQSRRRPPACALCRIRKLRCNRGSPCSNCSIRGVPCDLDRPSLGAGAGAGAGAAHPVLLPGNGVHFGGGGGPQEALNRNHLAPSLLASSQLQLVTADVLGLEKNCSSQKVLDSLAPPPLTFRTRSIRTITSPSFFVLHPSSSPALTEQVRVIKCICLPLRADAHILLDKFIKDVLHFHHIFHTPSLPLAVDRFYDAVEQGEPVDIGQLMVILAICCSSTHTWTRFDDSKGLFDRSADANAQTAGWLTTALDVIHHAHLAAHASLACIQGIVVVFFMICSLEGISARARLLHAQAVAMAQEIGLHYLDAPNPSSQARLLKKSTVEAEVGRRTWWYLTDTDWMLSRLSVPQQGAYTILPSQMAVRKPSNANDVDIVDGQEVVDRPLDEATSVSYLLQRIRLAELFYSLGSHDKSLNWNSEEADYGKIMEADMKLRQFMRELPWFFRLENSSALSKLPPSDIRRSSDITIQRYMLNMIFYGQICKLHLPYLARGTVNPGFAYSHDSCLKAAQRIIYIEHRMRAENSTFVLFRQRMNVKFRSIFIACVVFVLDGCLTTNEGGGTGAGGSAAGGGDATMTDAWKILHEARGQSPLASELLHMSIQILRKYRASHPALQALQMEKQSREAMSLGQRDTLGGEVTERGEMLVGSEAKRTDTIEVDNVDLDKLWETLQGRGRDWNNLFWSLGPPLISDRSAATKQSHAGTSVVSVLTAARMPEATVTALREVMPMKPGLKKSRNQMATAGPG
ncbi:Mitochondrial distribution and morphology protein 10 [Trichoderma ghanense]|uniref:Mitochondrial distribution and morphology protein 10 n=1 Tax=Trichoderma ghanense TaxID=65468 RepID=A0ABY2GV95_9HYPO